MNYRKWSIVSRILSLLSCVFLLIGLLSQPRNVAMLVLGVFFMTAGFIVSATKLKCPECGASVPERFGMKVEKCPRCGAKL